MLSRLSSIRIVKTITASAMASGFATGAMKSMTAPRCGVPGVSFTGRRPLGRGLLLHVLDAPSAALPMLLSRFGVRSAWIFCAMFWRYSGSFAPSETACDRGDVRRSRR